MWNLISKNPKTLLLILFLFIAALVLSLILIFSKKTSKIPPSPPPIRNQLTPKEQNYPEAQPQQFNIQSELVGSFVVTSNPEEARVIIDAPEEEVADQGTPRPVNLTPFKISTLPIGEHTLMLTKPGYQIYTTTFKIEEGKTTRLNVNLVPQEKNIGY